MKKILLFLVLGGVCVQAQARELFWLGHSLMGSETPQMTQYAAEQLDPDSSGSYSYDKQIWPGSSLSWHQRLCDPADSKYNPSKCTFEEQQPTNTLDFFIMTESEPLNNKVTGGVTQADALEWYEDQITANASTDMVFFYEGWTCLSVGVTNDCNDAQDVPGTDWIQRLTIDLPQWESVVTYVNANKSGGPGMEFIPTAQAWLAIHNEIQLGNLPGYTSVYDLFKDDFHPTDEGRYFMAMVVYSQIYDQSPVGLTNIMLNEYGNPTYDNPTTQQAAVFQQVAWDTVQTYNGTPPPPTDQDNDGVPDASDNCPAISNPGQEDADSDGVGDVCDNCPNDSNSGQFDADSDGVGNACDNCVNDYNPDQTDTDNDGIGDACDVVGGAYPTLQSVQGLDNPALGWNLNGVSDNTVGHPFLDIFKYTRKWRAFITGGAFNAKTYEQMVTDGDVDANGWPIRIPAGTDGVASYWAVKDDDVAPGNSTAISGSYTMTYDGEGTLQIAGVTNPVYSPGVVTFDIGGTADFQVKITDTDPLSTGDYIRNIVIVRDDRRELYDSGAMFNPDYIELLKDSRMVRFMNWAGTLDYWDDTDWSQRHTIDHAFWTQKVPIEVQVRLANELGADGWFHMPAYASADYATQLATYVRDNLDPDLRAYFELGNENWNSVMPQTSQYAADGQAKFDPLNQYGNERQTFHGFRIVETMTAINAVYAGQESRKRTVAGMHTSFYGLNGEVLLATRWETCYNAGDPLCPEPYVAPHTQLDAIANGNYFGSTILRDNNARADLIAAINLSPTDDDDAIAWANKVLVDDYTGTDINGDSQTYDVETYLDRIAKIQQFIDGYAVDYNLENYIYEGGQHVHHSAGTGLSQADLDAVAEFMFNYIRSQDMANLQVAQWDAIQALTGLEFGYTHHTEVDHSSDTGTWGILQSIDDNTPRKTDIFARNAANPAWWESRGGEHFQHGIIVTGSGIDETISGTNQEDYLIGRAGDDTFYAGPENDGINCGTGDDIVLVTGVEANYTIVDNGGGYFDISGPDGDDTLFDCETLRFESGPDVTLQGYTPPANTAPVVRAGRAPDGDDTTIAQFDVAIMDAFVSDDGNPAPPSITLTWTVISGPAALSCSANCTTVNAQYNPSVAGTYVLELEADDGLLQSTDQTNLIVTPTTSTFECDTGDPGWKTVTLFGGGAYKLCSSDGLQ